MIAEKINIIGGGIGGLTTALILKQRGLNVSVFEGSVELKPVGAGIVLANNAMQVYQKLGLQDKIERIGNKISYIKITDEQLHTLSTTGLSVYEQKYGVHHVAIHRGELQKILAQQLGYDHIHLAKRLAKIEKEECFKLTFEDNSTVECNILIGADGIKSVVRNQLFDKSILRNANQICWRGVCEIDLPQKHHNTLTEAWGKGKRFGFIKISNKKIYWYALANAKIINADETNLMSFFREFHMDILNVISATAKQQIIISDIIDLKPMDKWQKKNVCLIGDAAHATTPNLGQGACQAIEDAYVLGKFLDEGLSIENTFAKYEKARQKKAHIITNSSWTFGKIAHIENPLGIWLRNRAIKNMPKSVNKKQLDMIFKLN